MSNFSSLSQWIIQKYKDGSDIDSILMSCMQSGWEADSAITAVETSLQIKLEPAKPTPTPLFRNRTRLNVGDRDVQVILSVKSPKLLVVANMLADDECSELIELASSRLSRSFTFSVATGETQYNNYRTSDTAAFKLQENALIARIERRLEKFLSWPVSWGEGLQVQRYGIGNHFHPHHDYFSPAAIEKNSVKNQRIATVLLYLNEPEEGGGTAFTDIQLEISPRRGMAVFFAYDRPYPTTMSRHAGCPVLAGEKWVATKWLRDSTME